MNFLLYPKRSVFGWPQSDAYRLKSWSLSAICTALSFDTSFERERVVLWISSRRLSKETFPQLSLTLAGTFYPIAQKKLPGLCDGHWIAWRSSWRRFRVMLGRGKVVPPRYCSDVEQSFFIFFVLSDDLIRLSSPVCVDKTRPFGKIFKSRFVVF